MRLYDYRRIGLEEDEMISFNDWKVGILCWGKQKMTAGII